MDFMYTTAGRVVTLVLALALTALFMVITWAILRSAFAPKPHQRVRDHRISRSEQVRRQGSIRLPYRHWINGEESTRWRGLPDARRIELLDENLDEARRWVADISQTHALAIADAGWTAGETIDAQLVYGDEEATLELAIEAFEADPLSSWVDPSLAGADDEECTIAFMVFDDLAGVGDITPLGAMGSQVPVEMPHWGTEDDLAFQAFSESLLSVASQ